MAGAVRAPALSPETAMSTPPPTPDPVTLDAETVEKLRQLTAFAMVPPADDHSDDEGYWAHRRIPIIVKLRLHRLHSDLPSSRHWWPNRAGRRSSTGFPLRLVRRSRHPVQGRRRWQAGSLSCSQGRQEIVHRLSLPVSVKVHVRPERVADDLDGSVLTVEEREAVQA